MKSGTVVWDGLACVAGVQRGGRGKVECEREARREREAGSLGARPRRLGTAGILKKTDIRSLADSYIEL